MALSVVSVGKRGRMSSTPGVYINPKTYRLNINKKGITLLDKHSKKTVDHIIIMVDSDYKDRFWIKAAAETDPDSRKLSRKKVVMCSSVRTLLNGGYINFSKEEGGKSLGLVWDKEIGAARVSLAQK